MKYRSKLTDFEKFMLAQAIPSLALPELKDPNVIDLWERANIIGYGDGELASRGENKLRALYMLLGVLPASEEERKAVIR